MSFIHSSITEDNMQNHEVWVFGLADASHNPAVGYMQSGNMSFLGLLSSTIVPQWQTSLHNMTQ